MRRWVAQVLPPPWTVQLCAVVYVLIRGVEFVLRAAAEDHLESKQARTALLTFVAVGYAGYRIIAFHPAVRTSYRGWLSATPWRAPIRLPAGPIRFVLQDALVLSVLMALAFGASGAPALVLYAFLFAYGIVLSALNAVTGAHREAYVVAFGLGVIGLVYESETALIALAFALAVVAMSGLQRALVQFPWNTPVMDMLRNSSSLLGFQPKPASARLGFPYERLKHRSAEPAIPLGHVLLVSALAAWLTLIGTYRFSGTPEHFAVHRFLILSLTAKVVIFRIIVYCGEFWPPISLVGRIATRRWIIPDYDFVFLAPAATLTVGILFGWIAPLYGMPDLLANPLAVFFVLFVTLGAGPTLGQWRLVGRHRLMALPFVGGQFVRI